MKAGLFFQAALLAALLSAQPVQVKAAETESAGMPAFVAIAPSVSGIDSENPEGWDVAVDLSLMMTQNAYSDNWAGGEAGSVSWMFNSNSLAAKSLSRKTHVRNTLKVYFGQTSEQDKNTKKWGSPVKSTDRIEMESVMRFTLGGYVDPFAAGRVESQFLDASDPEVERVFNPAVITETIGLAKIMEGRLKRELSLRLGASLRQRISRNELDPVSGGRGTDFRNDGGAELVGDLRYPVSPKTLDFTSRLVLFQALFNSDAGKLRGLPGENYWRMLDVSWENILSAKVTEYVSVNLYVQLLYDREISAAGRLKQTLSMGLTYKLI